jgi:hypothetical protein
MLSRKNRGILLLTLDIERFQKVGKLSDRMSKSRILGPKLCPALPRPVMNNFIYLLCTIFFHFNLYIQIRSIFSTYKSPVGINAWRDNWETLQIFKEKWQSRILKSPLIWQELLFLY